MKTNYNLQNSENTQSAQPSKKGRIVTIIGMVFLIGTLVGITLFIVALYNGKFQFKKTNQVRQNRFSFGSFQEDEYVNEWAELSFHLDENWSKVSDDSYENHENEWAKIGFCAENHSGEIITISFADIAKESSKMPNKEIMRSFFERYDSEIPGAVCSDTKTQLKGLTEFTYIDIEGTSQNEPICNSVYIRRQDDFFIIIKVHSKSVEKNHALFELIEYY